MKILDKYIFTTFLKTFSSIFTILLLIFILQSVWLLIADLAGKDLSVGIILKFLLYLTPTLVPMVLPLTILLTSIMIFGNFAENYEFAAMKSSGISLQRAMKSLSIFIVFLSFVAFLFANYAIPWSEFKFRNLRRNIAQVNPAMAITEGMFNKIDKTTNIKVVRKYGEDERQLEDVTLHLLHRGTKNNTVIKAKRGELASSKGSNILQLILYDGNYYEDIISKDIRSRNKKLHAKSHFDKYTMNIDLSALDDVDMKSETVKNSYRMLNVSQLRKAIDSLSIDYDKSRQDLQDRAFSRLDLNTSTAPAAENKATNVPKARDTIPVFDGNVLDLFPDNRKDDVIKLALSSLSSNMGIFKSKTSNFALKLKFLNKHEMSLHKKFVLALSCIILFFVGAPLGAIIRKGGFGLPILFAITIFLAYHFIGIFAENSSEDGTIHPIVASYLSTAILFPFSIILTRNATRDRGVFSTDAFVSIFTGIFSFFTKKDGLKRFIEDNEDAIEIEQQHFQETVLQSVPEDLEFNSYVILRDLSGGNTEELTEEIAQKVATLKQRFIYSLYKVKGEDSVYLMSIPTNRFSDFVDIFKSLSLNSEENTAFWKHSDQISHIDGESVMLQKKYMSYMAVSNENAVYKIDENNNFLKSENREKIAFESRIFDTKNCQHIKDIFDVSTSKIVKKREPIMEPDKLLAGKMGIILYAIILGINIIAIVLGNTNPTMYYIAFGLNILGFIYFIVSAFKKPSKGV